jgi:cob(I)alamin adenosyltransferase
MVTLNQIITRTGDQGTTGLGDGSRIAKDHPLIAVIGSVDEANSLLGVVRLDAPLAELPQVQNDLFDLGADLATPPGSPWEAKIPRITDAQVARLEAWATAANAGLAPLTSFVLPAGSRASAWLHLARTVVRRAERDLVAAQHADPARAWNPNCLRYLNRLSDLCFIWARKENDGGKAEVLWMPGGEVR